MKYLKDILPSPPPYQGSIQLNRHSSLDRFFGSSTDTDGFQATLEGHFDRGSKSDGIEKLLMLVKGRSMMISCGQVCGVHLHRLRLRPLRLPGRKGHFGFPFLISGPKPRRSRNPCFEFRLVSDDGNFLLKIRALTEHTQFEQSSDSISKSTVTMA